MPARANFLARRRALSRQAKPAGGPVGMRQRPAMARLGSAGRRARSDNAGPGQAVPRAVAGARPNVLPEMMEELPSMRKRARTRPVAAKQPWQNSFWFEIPFVGPLVDALRGFFYPQEPLRAVKRGYVATGIGSIAKNRVMVKLEVLRQKRLEPRQEAQVLRNRTPGIKATIASQHSRGRIPGVLKYPRGRAA